MLELIVQEIERQGWSQTMGALTSVQLQEISDFYFLQRKDFSPAKVGSNENKRRVESVRGDFTLWIDLHEPPTALKPLVFFLNQLMELSNSRLYLGLRQFECHLSLYPPGAFYVKHSDRFEGNHSRTLSFIFYLHQSWTAGDGGELIIYDQSGSVIKAIEPIPGSFVCFLSEEFPHEVKSGKIERRSLTGWMHTKIIQ